MDFLTICLSPILKKQIIVSAKELKLPRSELVRLAIKFFLSEKQGMNHEQRIASLEREVAKLQEIIERNGLNKKFVTVPEASSALKINPWVIRDRIRNDQSLILGKHFQLNGKRYLINLAEWKKLIAADVAAKRL